MPHTPGPWKACPPRFGHQFVRQDPKDWDGHGYQHICTLPQSNRRTHYGEMFEANARLIAAAPDMLAELQRLDRKGGLGLDVHERIRTIIAKATTQNSTRPATERTRL